MTKINLHSKESVSVLLDDAYLLRSNNIPESIRLSEKALAISRNLNDKSLIGKSLNRLSLYYMIISDFDKSNEASKEAILCFEEINDELGVALAKYNIGSVHYKTNNYHYGLTCLIDALKIYRRHNDLHNQSKIEKAIGTIYEHIGDDANAYKFYRSAIRIARKLSDTNLESNVYNTLSGLLLKRGEVETAMKMIKKSIKLKKVTNDVRGSGFAIYGRGKVYYVKGENDKAESDFLEAVQIHKEMGENMGVTMALRKLGILYLNTGKYNKAQVIVKESLELSIRFNMAMLKAKNYHLLYQINKSANKISEALEYLEFYLIENDAIVKNQTLKVIENYDLINRMNQLESEALQKKEKQKSIDKKNRDEQEAVKRKQNFLSTMSHEIRTPLNAITTIVSILDNQVQGENKKLLNSLKFASNNLINIVNDILDFSKLDSKKAQLELRNSNFNELCNEIFRLHINPANNKNLNLVIENDIPVNRNYFLDQTKISQILNNLIGNAIKFTEFGVVTFKTSLLQETASHDTLMISIIDTGEGILKSDIEEVFESFSQVKPITTRKQGGTGLGLAIVKRLVELHNSEIKVNSKRNRGSEFYFTLKLEKAPEIEEIKKNNYYQLKGKTVLLAEDTPINSMLIKKLLSSWGVKTDHVVNGREAYEYAKNNKYDFILMDIHMPEMDGIDATRLIRTNENLNKNTPIFAVTADVMTNENDETLSLFDDVLLKPLEIEKLYEALAQEETNSSSLYGINS